MGAPIFSADVERYVGAPVPLVWAVVADSHRRNRMMAGRPATYDYQQLHERRTRVGRRGKIDIYGIAAGEAISFFPRY